MALEVSRRVPPGEKVLNWRRPYWSVISLFLYYSEHELTRPIDDRDAYMLRLEDGAWGIMTRAEYERGFTPRSSVVVEREGWVLVRGREARDGP